MILEVDNITKIYENKIVVDNVSFSMEQGKMMCILGPSGCGKTTILNMIGGFVRPNSGKIILEGKDITDLSAEKRNITTVFQSYGLFYHMNVFKNVSYGLKFKNLNKKAINEKVMEMINLVGLEGHEKKMIDELSGGQRQRVALARSLVLNPKLLLLDEPLSNLDQKLRVNMRLLIKNIQKNLGTTMIFVTHDQNEAFELADDIILMNKGEIEQHSNPKDIYKNPKNNFVLNFIGEKNIFEGYYVRPEDVKIGFEGKRGIIKDIIFQGSTIKLVISLGDKIIDAYVLNNEFKNSIGDEINIKYIKRKLPNY